MLEEQEAKAHLLKNRKIVHNGIATRHLGQHPCLLVQYDYLLTTYVMSSPAITPARYRTCVLSFFGLALLAAIGCVDLSLPTHIVVRQTSVN